MVTRGRAESKKQREREEGPADETGMPEISSLSIARTCSHATSPFDEFKGSSQAPHLTELVGQRSAFRPGDFPSRVSCLSDGYQALSRSNAGLDMAWSSARLEPSNCFVDDPRTIDVPLLLRPEGSPYHMGTVAS